MSADFWFDLAGLIVISTCFGVAAGNFIFAGAGAGGEVEE